VRLHGAHHRTAADFSGTHSCLHSQSKPYHGHMAELVFEVVQEADGGYCAECLTENIFTQGNTWEELRNNAVEATTAFFFDQARPDRIRLHLVRDEILSVA
jgi:predicted RNase H-like HicB family nuclease